MTVFVVHPITGNNIDDAKRFGELVFVNDRFVYSDEINDQLIPLSVVRNIKRAAADFNATRDYLLIAGDHLQLTQFAAQLGKLYREFHVLRWERQADAYLPVRIVT